MARLARVLVTGLIAVLFLPAAALAATPEQPRQQGPAAGLVPVDPAPGLRSDCALGNPADPTYNFGNWITGGDVYACLVQPEADGCGCPTGVQVDRISMLMQFGPEDVPSDFDVQVGLAEALYDDVAGLWRPGDTICTSATWALSAPDAGLYEIYVDLEGACPCATVGDAYFITFALPQSFVWWPDALEDDTPDPGVSYYDGGDGWEDLILVHGWWGNNIMRAQASCCDDPVATEASSWSELKSLYR